ncbi:MAG: hypothetical protein N2560_09940 [Ignavibacteria bacterium]|nr:hypothetical protein [Ignavibacteria bacterium]
MSFLQTLAKVDNPFRKFFVARCPYFSCLFYSHVRKLFLKSLVKERPKQVHLPSELRRSIWDIQFRSPIFNAAGMFKEGEGYILACLQSAGAFLAGTVTPNPKFGNYRKGIKHPFLPYPHSKSSSNWMGLPNPGYLQVRNSLKQIEKQKDVPLVLSLAADGNMQGDLQTLCEVLRDAENSNFDFVELNESCPNIEHNGRNYNNLDENFLKRIEFISEKFLKNRKRNLPVILKLSNDFDPKNVPNLIDVLLDLQFDGLNFGNTSTDYKGLEQAIHPSDRKSFEYFINTFGGGISGSPLKEKSFILTQIAMEHIKQKSLTREFHIIRTGGIFDFDDYSKSVGKGVSLFQWFTGYFENFINFGHFLYLKFFTK